MHDDPQQSSKASPGTAAGRTVLVSARSPRFWLMWSSLAPTIQFIAGLADVPFITRWMLFALMLAATAFIIAGNFLRSWFAVLAITGAVAAVAGTVAFQLPDGLTPESGLAD